MNNALYWIGIRESELDHARSLFSGSITIFGTNHNGNHAFEHTYKTRYDYNQDDPRWNRFVARTAAEIIRQEPDCRFLAYAAEDVAMYGQEVMERTICCNPTSLVELLGDKFRTRQWLSEYVPILPYKMVLGAALSYTELMRSFPGHKSFVVQSSYSCGGSGTWLLSEANAEGLLGRLDQDIMYAVSPYHAHSISPNIHVLIYGHEVILLPPSIQLVEPDQYGFSYKGADYPLYRKIPADSDQKLRTHARMIGTVLQKAGYRGICGIDFLISDNTIFLMEVNARFQSSSFLLNRCMYEAGLDISLQSLQIDAFQTSAPNQSVRELTDLTIPYSFFHYSYRPNQQKESAYIWQLLKCGPDGVDCIDDGLDWDMTLEAHTYLYKAVFTGSITSWEPIFRCHANVGIPEKVFSAAQLRKDPERLKLMLLSHGVRLNVSGEQFNHAEFDALDLVLEGHIYVCVPYGSNLSWLSPFYVEVGTDSTCRLLFYGQYVMDVSIRRVDDLGGRRTSHGHFYCDITYLGNDRLRVYQRAGCYFKDQGLGCQFCDIPQAARMFTLDDVFQAMDAYRNLPPVRHYLIGGGSNAPDDDFASAIAIAEHIRDTTGKPIYLMSLPPQNANILARLQQAGITEVAFNLEVFDRDVARRYMPGKGAIPLSVYENAFRAATQLWGTTGNVRTIFVVGLEASQSLLDGIEYVVKMGVSPILSLFRPAAGTQLQDLIPPSDEEIWEIYQQAKGICSRYGIPMGPGCPCCEDNTMKVTL